MQSRPNEEALKGMDGYEHMVNTAAENAKAYWKLWGPLGEPMIRSIDAWAEMQRGYLAWLRQAYGSGGDCKNPTLGYRDRKGYMRDITGGEA